LCMGPPPAMPKSVRYNFHHGQCQGFILFKKKNFRFLFTWTGRTWNLISWISFFRLVLLLHIFLMHNKGLIITCRQCAIPFFARCISLLDVSLPPKMEKAKVGSLSNYTIRLNFSLCFLLPQNLPIACKNEIA
jgi:hypothetical protein